MNNDKKTIAHKALCVLKKNLNVYDLIELVELLPSEIEKQSQEMMAEGYKSLNS